MTVAGGAGSAGTRVRLAARVGKLEAGSGVADYHR